MGQGRPSREICAVAVLHARGVTGNVLFTERRPGLTQAFVRLEGLSPGAHGFHIHAAGDLRGEGCVGCGAHYNPRGQQHGGRTSPPDRHPGDLGNVNADAWGRVDEVIEVPGVRLRDIVGRSVVVHAAADDLGRGIEGARKESLLTGNSGSRLACGVIGWAEQSCS